MSYSRARTKKRRVEDRAPRHPSRVPLRERRIRRDLWSDIAPSTPNVITALGLRLELSPTNTLTRSNNPASDPAVGDIRVGDYTQLRRAAWQLDEDTKLTEAEALQLYERNWRHIDAAAMDRREKEFVQHLADTLSHGRILV